MVKKVQKTSSTKGGKAAADTPLTGSVKDSAQQIWLAGLGAFNKAQAEGGKVFETLVKEGLAIQRKTQAAAEEKLSEATNKMASMATDLSSRASGRWDKLETIFEDRVARALAKLGVPSAKEVEALIGRIDELSAAVQKLSGKPTVAAKAPAKAPAKTAVKAARPKAAPAPAAPAVEAAAAKPAPRKRAPKAAKSPEAATPASE